MKNMDEYLWRHYPTKSACVFIDDGVAYLPEDLSVYAGEVFDHDMPEDKCIVFSTSGVMYHGTIDEDSGLCYLLADQRHHERINKIWRRKVLTHAKDGAIITPIPKQMNRETKT